MDASMSTNILGGSPLSAGTMPLSTQRSVEWLYMQDEDASSAPMRQPVPVSDQLGTPRYYVTRTRSWPSDRYEVAAADGRSVASIRQRRFGSFWYQASMASGQVMEIRIDWFGKTRWLRLRGMGLTLVPLEQDRPRADLSLESGAPIARFDYEQSDGVGRISRRYAIGIFSPGWEDVAVTAFALVRYECFAYFDAIRGSGTP